MENIHTAHASITVNATPAEVWRALTTPSLIKEYLMGTDVTSEWEEGGTIGYSGVYEGKEYHDKGIIKKMIPGRIFQSTYWSSMTGKDDKPENYHLVTYRITKRLGKTIVTVTQDNISSEKEKELSTANWKMVLSKLKEVVERKKEF